MNIQIEILTKSKLWIKDGLWNNINPFYGASTEYIEKNKDFAKRVYSDIFNFQIVPSYVAIEAEKLGIDVVESVGIIKPMENYNLLKELRI